MVQCCCLIKLLLLFIDVALQQPGVLLHLVKTRGLTNEATKCKTFFSKQWKIFKKSGVRPPSLHWKNVPGSWFSIVVSCCSLIILIIITIITIVVIVIIIYYYLYIIITFYCCLLLTLIFFIFVMVMVITCEWNELNQTKLNHVQVSSLSSQNLPAPHWLSLKPHNVWVAQPIASSHPVILPTAPPVAHLYHQFPFFFGWPWSVFKTWAITTPNNHPCFCYTLAVMVGL